MANPASLTGLMCRILLLTSVAYNDTNRITLEFSTPRFLAPPSMFFCFTNTDFVVTQSSLSVVSLTEGGSIFTVAEKVVIPSPATFLTGDANLDPTEISTVYEVLGTDPYYAGSYKLQRYDDLIADQQGTSIKGMVDFPVNLNADVPAGTYLNEGNCFLLTGNWAANTRYQMNISVTNPPPPPTLEVPWPPPPPVRPPPPSPPRSNTSSSRPPPSPAPPMPPPGPPFMQLSNNATPILWVAPVTTSTNVYGSGTANTFTTLTFSVRGNKYGAACPLRSAIVTTMGTMFDACAESRKRGLGPPGNSTNVALCLSLLRRVASQPGNKGSLPFTAPPLTTYNMSSFRDTSCSGSNTALGPRFGGECISCGTYGVKQSATSCVCPDGILPNLVGNVACGDPLTPDGNVTSLSDLPGWLCAQYSEAKTKWQSKQLLDHNVAKQYGGMFTQLASALLDQVTMYNALQAFNSTYVFDDRRPYSPTRKYGLKPNCAECTDGMFRDAYSKTMVPIFDWHFDAMNTFRFLGYVLDQELGYPCPALWDRSKPMEWGYGYYDQVICKPMPPGTCCGDNFFGK